MPSWSFLSPGDTVDIVAPASSTPELKLEEGLEFLKTWNLVPRIPEGMINVTDFFAAPLEKQFQDLKDAIYSDSKAIWCLRGGYGSMRLVPLLNKLKPPKKPKLFIGFSDVTSLHLFFNQKWNWPTLHGRTISQLVPEKIMSEDRQDLKKIIFGETSNASFSNLIPLNKLANQKMTIKGKIVGGNFRILQSSLGTAWEVKPKGKILFIEDVNERGYSVHRMLEQLFQAKIIDKGLKALIIGDFTDGLEKDGRDLTLNAFKEFAEKLPYPVLHGLPCGHGKILNYALPLNTSTNIILGKTAKLVSSSNGNSLKV